MGTIDCEENNNKYPLYYYKIGLKHYKQIFENSTEAIAIIDNEFKVINVNKSFERLFQYELDELKGRKIKEIICHKEFCDNQCVFQELEEKGYVKRRIKKIRRDGKVLFTDILTWPIKIDKEQTGMYLIYRDVTENKIKEDRIEYLIHRDCLTGLYNREFFLEKIEEVMCNGVNNKLAVLVLDFDNFKRINNTLGYLIGDKIIKSTADKLISSISNEHTIARISGNHFMILMTDVRDEETVRRIAEKIINIFDNPIRINDYEVDISGSIGISIYPDDGFDKEVLIRNAEIAMYKAKEKCGNSIEMFSSNMGEEIEDQFILFNNLRKALSKDQFEVHYQPIIDLKTNEIVAAEALLRWKHPKLGYISPTKFIPIAENNGLILQIGEWILKTACLQNIKWQNAGYKPIVMAVNVSVRQLEQKNFVDEILKALDISGLDPRFLELEITESLNMKNINSCISNFQKLNKLGVSISIDDFGTGYSSLGQLKKLSINKLKIDKTFIDDIKGEMDDNPIISAIMAIARSLKLQVIAEGIEDLNQLNYLKKLDCEMGQGYFFSRPMSAEKFEIMIKNN
ncbi:EAL domain-containing protein [Wukongibacter baidiensis]|uniref:sensor domain-containing protein n=1 Tax=Wukongibacter baidiensis TaxID=1723361 RepID=UPI003D7F3576